MQKMSGLDLRYSVAELAALQGKRIARIKKTAGGIFLFKIGSLEMLFEPGIRLHLTRQALQATESPDGFVGLLRKNFEGKTAQKISQYNNDRIVEIETRSKERLVFELFRKGNLVVIGEDGMIFACLQKEEMGGRKIARGEKYCYPKATAFELKIPEKLAFLVQENEKGEPVSYSLDKAKGGREFAGFSEAADHYYANQTQESETERLTAEKVKKLKERLSSQQEALARMGVEREERKLSGDTIYANFELVEQLLALVRKLKKEGAGEEEINSRISAFKAKLKGSELEVDI